jgi:heme-degrading monooxygenase HmoA
MFVVMSTVKPKPGREDDLATALHSLASRVRGRPGLVGSWVLRDRDSAAFVGLSIWDSEEAFRTAVAAAPPLAASVSAETFRDAPPVVRTFDSR